MTGFAEEFEYTVGLFTEYVLNHEDGLPLRRLRESRRAADPGNRRALGSRHEVLLSLMRKRTGMSQWALLGVFGIDQGTISRYLKYIDGILKKILPDPDTIEEMNTDGTADADRIVPDGFIMLDCTEVRVTRSGNSEEELMTRSGKKGMNTYSTMVCTNRVGLIIGLSESRAGSDHDFETCRKGRGHVSGVTDALRRPVLCMDRGFVGIEKHAGPGVGVMVPRKKPRNGQLTAADRAWNRKVSRKRNGVERTIGYVKTYARMSGTYDSDLERFREDLNVTAGIINLHIMWRKLKHRVRCGEPPPHWSAYFG